MQQDRTVGNPASSVSRVGDKDTWLERPRQIASALVVDAFESAQARQG